jgi:hypothetical protein
MTPQKSFYRKKNALYSAMMRYGLDGILRAGWVKTAVAGHHRTDGVLIKPYRQEQYFAH